jgi:aspartyl/asparaginyl beta-hydroxylase (cupin superfamily)
MLAAPLRSMTTLPLPRPTLRQRVRTSTAEMGRNLERWLGRVSLVGGGEILANDAFPWAAELEANWRSIRLELDRLMPTRAALPNMQEISTTQYGITREPVWKVFAFSAFGMRSELNCAQCPETARLLAGIPNLELAFFSVLEPGAHLTAHRGSYKGLVRAHLGLIVPEPRASVRMQVGKAMVHWEEGRCVVFDDTYRHEVWNDTDGVRVVLLIDIHRPFPALLDWINKAILRLARFTPFVTDSIKRMRAWEKDYYATPPAASGG